VRVQQISDRAKILGPPFQSFIHARITRRSSANACWANARRMRVHFNLSENLMNIVHDQQCAKRHTAKQVPNDTLQGEANLLLTIEMENDFQRAFLRHLEMEKTSLADLVRATGVSRNVLNKLKSREGSSTSVESGMLIAAFYGKTLNEFVTMQEASDVSRVKALLEMLTQAERHILESQIRGILSEHKSEK